MAPATSRPEPKPRMASYPAETRPSKATRSPAATWATNAYRAKLASTQSVRETKNREEEGKKAERHTIEHREEEKADHITFPHYLVTITYLVGCTDPTYGSPECPGKGPYTGQQLVGLTRCDPDVTEWAGCKDDEGRTKPEPRHENCTCEGQSPLFEAGAKLEDIAFLPLSAGGKMSWFPGPLILI